VQVACCEAPCTYGDFGFVVSEESGKARKRRRYSDGLGTSEKFKNNGVKKVMLLLVAPDAKEEQKTVGDFLLKLNLERNTFQFNVDLKLANIASGIGTHSSRHPSPFCNWRKNSHDRCTSEDFRTFQSIHKNNAAWLKSGGRKSDVKDYMNCTGLPLSIFPEYGRVIDYIPLPQLHIKMGVVNKLFEEMERVFPEAIQWPQKLHLVREDYHQQFEGKSNTSPCKTFFY
jgi:hypothetical protein